MSTDVLDSPEAGGLVIRGGVLRIVSFALSTVLSVVAAAIVIRHLGASDFGRYIAIFSIITLIGSVTDAGMTTLGVREYAIRTGEDRRALLRNLLGLRLALTVAGVLVALVFVAAANDYDDAQLAGAALAGAGLLVTVMALTLTVPLTAELLIGRVSVLELARQALTTAAMVALVLAGAGIVALLAVSIPVGIVMLVVTAAMVRGRMALVPSLDVGAWMRLLRMTAAFAAATAVGTIYVYLAVVVMPLVTTDEQVGNFGVAFRVFIVLVAVPGLLVSTALPLLARAARDDRERLAHALDRLLQVSIVIGALFALLTAVGAPVAVDVIAGTSGFDDAVSALRIQALAMLASFLLAPFAYGLISLHLHRELLVANLSALIVSLAVVLALAGPYGAQGAAVGTVVGELLLAVAYAVSLSRADPRLRPRPAGLGKVVIATVAAGAIAVLPGWGALPASIAAAAVYVIVILALRGLPEELRRRLPLPARLR